MEFNQTELVDAVNKVLASTSRVPSWNTWTQYELESRRRKLSNDRAAQYNALQVLNSVKRAVSRTNYKVPSRIKSEHVVQELDKVDSKERRNAKAFINGLNGQIRKFSVAYTVVTSSYLLADEVFYRQEGNEPPILKNEKRRWYKTASMYNVYAEMLRNSKVNIPEAIKDCRRAASLGLSTAGGWPVLLSLHCTFDLNGVIDGLPEGYRVIMFKPRTATITKKWVRPKKTDGEKFEEGLTVSV